MGTNLVLQNLLNPPDLFFFLGAIAVFTRSDLEIPAPLPKLFSLYLLLAIGFKGGLELQKSGFNEEVLTAIGAAVIMALIIPLICFCVLRIKLDVFNAAAISAAYGSISAVTFITAQSFLETLNIQYDGFMVAALALMESPAIIVGLVLVKLGSANTSSNSKYIKWRSVLREAVLNSSVYLLIGSLIIGFLTAAHSPSGIEKMNPFTDKLFYGALCFFLLDMGIVAAQRLKKIKKLGPFLISFSILMPIILAIFAALISQYIGLGQGNSLLFIVLCSSASYIAVPAAMRMTVPEANPNFYISTALGLTFPFNIIFGIPLYMSLVNKMIPYSL
tara:strand:- start:804 stop:1799 length:996 start_codon:yes stop_codon:yes gene_type:complete